jgi:hypothetical protein
MIALILCVILVLLLGLLLFTPFQLWIDSTCDRYQLRWGRLARAGLVPARGDLLVQLWVLGWRKSFSLFALLRGASTPRKPADKASRSRRTRFSWPRIRKLLRTFKVRQWRVDIDTDDVVWNAYLFPASYFLQRAHYPLSINYEGRVEVELLVENRPIWMVKALLF